MNLNNINLCNYKNLTGAPGTGIHSLKLFGISVYDVIITLLIAKAIALSTKRSFVLVSVALFVLGIIVHRLLCVDTAVNVAIFGKVAKDNEKIT